MDRKKLGILTGVVSIIVGFVLLFVGININCIGCPKGAADFSTILTRVSIIFVIIGLVMISLSFIGKK